MLNALNTSVSGLKAQDTAMSGISGNISNSSSTGYKGVYTAFKTMINDDDHYYGSGVITEPRYSVEVAGAIDDTGIVTDLAVQGNGMFVVNTDPGATGQTLFTREGSFRKDKVGNLQNIAGAYLMAWPLDKGDNLKSDFASLEVVNLYSLAQDVVATSDIEININLDASEKIEPGMVYEIATEPGMKVDDVLYDEKLRIGDGFSILMNNGVQSYDFIYGGFSAGNSIATNSILGSNSIGDNFSALKDGDTFSVKTEKSATMVFSYKSVNPNTTAGQFNSMTSLADAINSRKSIKATIKDNVLAIAPVDTKEAVTFSNGFDLKILGTSLGDLSTAFGARQFYDTVNSFDMSSHKIYGVEAIVGASSQPFSSGVTNGDGLLITTDSGNKYSFAYSDTPDAGKMEFNSLASLADIILNNSGGELNATISNDIMTIEPIGNVYLTSITDINQPDSCSNFATTLNIAFDTQFKNGAVSGDKLRIAYGSYHDVASVANNCLYCDVNSILGTKIAGIDLSLEGVYGLTADAAAAAEAFKTTAGATVGDGIKITTSAGESTFSYAESPTADQRQFNSLQTLADSINSNTVLNLEAKIINNSSIVITSKDPSVQIYNIDNNNVSGQSDFATTLKLKVNMPKNGDALSINMTNNEKFTLKFTSASGGSGNSGAPDYTLGEFNNVVTLQKALQFISGGELSSAVKNNVFHITPTSRSLSSVSSISNIGSANLADYLGITVSSHVLDFQYIDKYAHSTSSKDVKLPVTQNGEFNNLATLRRAIKDFSDGVLDAQFINSKLVISTMNGGTIDYIVDQNIYGKSNLAQNLGIDGYDIVGALGLEDIKAEPTRFSKLTDLGDLINATIPNISAVADKQGLKITVDDVTSSIDFKNLQNQDEGNNLYSNSDFLMEFNLNNIDHGPKYQPDDSTKNMASGNLEPQFTTNIRVYDSLGINHDLDTSFIKIGTNKWAMEIYAADSNEITNGRQDGLIAYADIEFNGDGNLNIMKFTPVEGASSSASYEMGISWSNGASQSQITLDFGDIIGDNTGLRQLGGDYNIGVSEQNGYGLGELSRIDINEEGIISANFSNGSIRQVYQIPIVTFLNPDGLNLLTGNLYQEGSNSGLKRIQKAGMSSVGSILSSSLEGANVDMTKELTRMIPIEHAYQANAKVIQTVDKLLEEFYRILT